MTSPALRDALEALEPFANYYDAALKSGDDPDSVIVAADIGSVVYIRWGHLRRAAKAYEALRANSSDVSVPREPTEMVGLHPLIRGGRATITATGFTVAQLLAEIAEGDRTLKEIVDDFDLNLEFAVRALTGVSIMLDSISFAEELSASPQAKGEGDNHSALQSGNSRDDGEMHTLSQGDAQ